jgi:hypothetical protein
MFRGLHIEMAAFKLLGDLLKGTGWVTALSEADIASLGTAESSYFDVIRISVVRCMLVCLFLTSHANNRQ